LGRLKTGRHTKLLWTSQYDLSACPGASTGTYLAEEATRKDKGIRRKTEGKISDESLLVI